ncbi:MAG: helix-turn-helix domain-containing protein [Betaproteobacteria bacterium]|nr:helix-turn-helix domain-containing protein [Betaproteobacteria bacterium]
MTEPVGAELRNARERLGLTISEVAHHLKLAPRQVEALEEERFEQLPGVTFVRGMLKTYARLLRLEPEPFLERLAGRFEAPDASRLAARYSQPVPFSDSARHSTFIYLGLSIVVLALGGGVAYQWYREHKAPAELAQAKRTPANPPAVASAAPAAPRPVPKLAEPVVESELTAKVAVALEPEKAAQPEKRAIEKASVAKVAAPGSVNRLVIRCEEDAWIEVKDANDRMLVSSLNPKGSERIVRARGPLTLVIGNAAHVQITHNERPVDLAPHTKLTIARFTLP